MQLLPHHDFPLWKREHQHGRCFCPQFVIEPGCHHTLYEKVPLLSIKLLFIRGSRLYKINLRWGNALQLFIVLHVFLFQQISNFEKMKMHIVKKKKLIHLWKKYVLNMCWELSDLGLEVISIKFHLCSWITLRKVSRVFLVREGSIFFAIFIYTNFWRQIFDSPWFQTLICST